MYGDGGSKLRHTERERYRDWEIEMVAIIIIMALSILSSTHIYAPLYHTIIYSQRALTDTHTHTFKHSRATVNFTYC